MPRRKIIIWLATVLFVVMTVIGIDTFNKRNQQTITIAVAAPLSNTGKATQTVGESIVRGVKLYINQINKEGGIQGKRLKLKVYDDQAKPEVAVKVAEEIVKSPAIAVIGHYSSSTSKAAGKIYQAAGIPAVSGSATADSVTQDNEWYFRTIFSDRFQGTFIANYLRKVLGFSKISIIHGYDAYGLGLGQTVEAAFRQLGGEIVAKWQLPENQNPATDEIILQQLQQLQDTNNNPEAVVFATNRDQVINILQEMKNRNLNFPRFGGDDLGDVALAKVFGDLPEEKENPGFYTNNFYATVPIIYDVANDLTQEFRKTFEQVYGTSPGWSAASYYDAAYAIGEAINRTLLAQKGLSETTFTSQDVKQDRSLVRAGLAQINRPEVAIQGGARSFYFDGARTATVPVNVGLFERGNLVSAFSQLQIIPNIKLLPNSSEQIASGKLLQIGQQYLQKTDIVYVGVDINEVSYLDEKSSTYVLDFYLWFRYKGNINPDDIEFTNYGISRLDSGEKLTLGEPIQQGQENGVNYKVYRLKADFHEEFDFHDYPFDDQRLAVRFRHANLTRDQLIYALDMVGMRDSNIQKVSRHWQKKVFKEISSWMPQKIVFFQDTLVNNSTLGYRRLINTGSGLEYSQFNAVIDIKRDLLSFSIKNLLPLWFFVAVAYLLLFLPFDQLSVEALSGLLLAVVFYHLSLLQALPDGVGYVVALDYAFYLVYLLLGLELLILTLGHYDRFTKDQEQHQLLILCGRVLFPSIIAVGFLGLYLVYF